MDEKLSSVPSVYIVEVAIVWGGHAKRLSKTPIEPCWWSASSLAQAVTKLAQLISSEAAYGVFNLNNNDRSGLFIDKSPASEPMSRTIGTNATINDEQPRKKSKRRLEMIYYLLTIIHQSFEYLTTWFERRGRENEGSRENNRLAIDSLYRSNSRQCCQSFGGLDWMQLSCSIPELATDSYKITVDVSVTELYSIAISSASNWQLAHRVSFDLWTQEYLQWSGALTRTRYTWESNATGGSSVFIYGAFAKRISLNHTMGASEGST